MSVRGVSRFFAVSKVLTCVSCLTAVLTAVTIPSGANAAERWPSKVSAKYAISFNGFSIGSFQLNARISRGSYVLDGDANISALLGLVSWRGLTRSSGHLKNGGPQPKNYNFNFKSSAKSGAVRMGFKKNTIESISMVPPIPVASDEVPLERSHLSGVFDPLSAVMALTKGRSTNPCKQTLPVFDGKQRFNLKLSYVRQQTIDEMRPSGQPGSVIVCRVRYAPIAGYRPTSDIRRMAASNDILIALRPIPKANMFIPYEIRIPTSAGTVVLSSQTVDIVTTDSRQIALIH